LFKFFKTATNPDKDFNKKYKVGEKISESFRITGHSKWNNVPNNVVSLIPQEIETVNDYDFA
jgi:hypothetical protein